jgi:hypothetical protein
VRSVARPLAAACVVLALIVAAAATLSARDRWYPRSTVQTRDLLVTSGDTIGRLGLGFDAALADLYWIRAVQHYGRDRRSLTYAGRYELLHPLIDITTTLDPHFSTAYLFGAIFLSESLPMGPGRLDQGIALLEKGLRAEPTRWQYAQYLGFLHYWHDGDRREAGRQFARAAAIPGAPIWLKPLAADMFADGGDRATARMILDTLVQNEEPWIRDLAQRKLRELGPS